MVVDKLFFHLFDLATLNSYIFFLIRRQENFALGFLEYTNEEFTGTGWP
jgi:hypothetical protein